MEPVIVARAAWLARAASFWRGHVPILSLPGRIYWPGAVEDFSPPGHERQMAVLQHELQHVLEFGAGVLSPLRYLLNPRNWAYTYRLFPGCAWADFGAEQRARLVEDYWLIERGLKAALLDPIEEYRRLIPWVDEERD
ncbi:MAG TPA: hypothetical protein VF559_04255 [Caulobacteraceae bacterium]